MPKLIDLSGQRFERLTVLEHVYGARWLCRCECGVEREFLSQNLRSGRSRSCGCLQREYLSEAKRGNKNNYKHGHSPATGTSPEYRCWAKMKDRCLNPNAEEYRNYGGRGITVCERWLESFVNFLSDMGPRPDASLSIERIDNDGDYEPGNCKWGMKSEQSANRRPYKWKVDRDG